MIHKNLNFCRENDEDVGVVEADSSVSSEHFIFAIFAVSHFLMNYSFCSKRTLLLSFYRERCMHADRIFSCSTAWHIDLFPSTFCHFIIFLIFVFHECLGISCGCITFYFLTLETYDTWNTGFSPIGDTHSWTTSTTQTYQCKLRVAVDKHKKFHPRQNLKSSCMAIDWSTETTLLHKKNVSNLQQRKLATYSVWHVSSFYLILVGIPLKLHPFCTWHAMFVFQFACSAQVMIQLFCI